MTPSTCSLYCRDASRIYISRHAIKAAAPADFPPHGNAARNATADYMALRFRLKTPRDRRPATVSCVCADFYILHSLSPFFYIDHLDFGIQCRRDNRIQLDRLAEPFFYAPGIQRFCHNCRGVPV